MGAGERRRQHENRSTQRPGQPGGGLPNWVRPVVIVGVLVAALGLSLYLGGVGQSAKPEPQTPAVAGSKPDDKAVASPGASDPAVPERPEENVQSPHGSTPPASHAESKTRPSGGGFLEAFGSKEPEAGGDTAKPATDAELEKQFQRLAALNERLDDLRSRVRANPALTQTPAFADMKAEQDRLVAQLNKGLGLFEKVVGQARTARPKDPVPLWLTGELLILVGGEPEAMLPYFRRAADGGLQTPRVLASLSRAEVEANHLEEAYRLALKALDQDDKNRYTWNAFTRAAFNVEKFSEVITRLDRAFPEEKPEWAKPILKEAAGLLAKWQREENFRQADRKADDLPRVRLVIEHRQFVRDPSGTRTSKIESSGKGEVILELFEDQAPATVANFLDLVEKGFYDGTRFYRAEPARVVAGGDPKSKNPDPADDGTGGPGYVIPDEFSRPDARGHFRGSVSMVNTGPHTAGSQFFINLTPKLEMDRFFTVFGRVIAGQDVVDQITMGRTTPRAGEFGRVVPGDLVVRAEVLRKRPHEYKVIKEQAPMIEDR